MQSISIDVDQVPGLGELVDEAVRNGEVVLMRDGQPVARIVPLPVSRAPRRPGSAHGQFHMADDFDAMPEEFEEYF